MSEKEFDLYLSLLARMLRLTEDQKAAIADELHDHLEQRFVDLVNSGLPREDAIRRALEDVGDAAGLANSFTALSRQSRRKQLARISVSSAVILLLAAWGVVTFWPQQPGGMPGKPVVAQAQQQPAAASTANVAPPTAADDIRYVDPRRFLPEGLRKVVREEHKDITLHELVKFIREESGLDCLLDMPHFKEEGITGEEQVTLFDRLPLALSLDHALKDVNDVPLTWRLDSGVLFITTQARADVLLETRTFNIELLLSRGYRVVRNAARNDLISILEDTTTGIWNEGDEIGGTMDVVGNVMIVRQTARCLGEVACVLEALNTPARMLWLNRPIEDQPILKALQERLAGATFSNVTLSSFAESLEKRYEIPVKLDHTRLSEEGVTGEEEINLDGIRNQTLANVLRWILTDVNGVPLEAVVDRGVLSITTQAYSGKVLDHAMLDVSDLLRVVEPEILTQLVIKQTSGIWNEQGEEEGGGTATVTPDGRLLVSQTDKVLNEILELIPQIRAQLNQNGVQPRDPQRLETRYYRLPHATAKDLLEVIPQHIEPVTWHAKEGQAPRGLISLVSLEEIKEVPQIRSGSGGGFFQFGGGIGGQYGGGTSGQLPEKPAQSDLAEHPQAVLVIRQTVAIHQQIQAFINEVIHGHPDGPPKTPRFQFFSGLGGGIPSQVIAPGQ